MFTILDLQRRLGLSVHELDALASFTGEDCFEADGTPREIFTKSELEQQVHIYVRTCTAHGVYECNKAECNTAA